MLPDTSRSKTRRRGRSTGARQARRIGTPPVAHVAPARCRADRAGRRIAAVVGRVRRDGRSSARDPRAPRSAAGPRPTPSAVRADMSWSTEHLGRASSARPGRRRPAPCASSDVGVGVLVVVDRQRQGWPARPAPRRAERRDVLPEGREHPVVGRDVLRPAHQGGPTGPVHAWSGSSRPTRARASANRTTDAGRHRQARRPQAPGRSRPRSAPAACQLGLRRPASCPTLACGADQLVDAGRPHPSLVLLVLEDGAQGEVEGALVDLAPPEGGQGRRPVDGLGHPGGL